MQLKIHNYSYDDLEAISDAVMQSYDYDAVDMGDFFLTDLTRDERLSQVRRHASDLGGADDLTSDDISVVFGILWKTYEIAVGRF